MRNDQPSNDREPLAIVGIGCRFPGAVNDTREYWHFLLNGIDAIREIPTERWDASRYYHPDPNQPGAMYSRWGGFLDQVDRFDAGFFGITPAEASRMDPQQQALLETSWEAMEDAGIVPHTIAGSQTGVFVGICTSDYGILQTQDLNGINAYTNAGRESSIASNRISYVFDFHGPSFSVDTACSSALVAVHLACESLWKGECSLALVGGANTMIYPALSVGFSKAHMLSPSGRCNAFDAAADGYVRGEGVAVAVLKPLSAAIAAGNPIYATILASGINQDGRTPGLHYPNRQAQEALLHQVYQQADIAPQRVCYVEAHGAGTAAGDMVEGNALGTVLGRQRPEGQWLRIGSVKTQIGHLEGSSGMAALVKAALILKHRQIPASLHFQTPNPQIPFEQLRLQVPQQVETLPPSSDPLVVGVNNFGFGGANAHIVLQEYQQPRAEEARSDEGGAFLLPLSARHPEALRALAQSYQDFLSVNEPPSLRDICWSASLRREQHPFRLALASRSRAGLSEQLAAFLDNQQPAGVSMGHAQKDQAPPSIVFVFSGNGSQWWAMGRQLLAENTLFREVIERCDRLFALSSNWSLLEALKADEASSQLHRTQIAQPTLFALQVALAELWKSWGIEPQVVVGHSVGEIAAAYVAGILSLEDALRVVFHRSRLQEKTAGAGKMAAVSLSVQEAQTLLAAYKEKVFLAGINSPASVTLSGNEEALEQIVASLKEQGVFARMLNLNYGFHCPLMDPLRKELLASLKELRPQRASIPFVSSATGEELLGPECDASYWWDNMRLPVRFSEVVLDLLRRGHTTFLEVGPHPILSQYVKECLASKDLQGTILPSLRRKEDDQVTLLGSLGALYTLGAPVRWEALIEEGQHVPLPLYPWQRERHWNEPAAGAFRLSHAGLASHPLLGSRLETAPAVWENVLDLQLLPFLAEHQVQGAVVFPAVGYLQIALAATAEILEEEACMLEEFEVRRPLILSASTPSIIQTVFSLDDHTFQIYSRPQAEHSEWAVHASGRFGKMARSSSAPAIDRHEIRQRCQQEIDAASFYQRILPPGFQFGPSFTLIQQVYLGELEALSQIKWLGLAEDTYPHTGFLDTSLHMVYATVSHQKKDEQDTIWLPVSARSIRLYRQPCAGKRFYAHQRISKEHANGFQIEIMLFDEDGQPILEITGLRMQAISGTLNAQTMKKHSLYEEQWMLSPLAPAPRGALKSTPTLLLFTDTHGVAAQLQERLLDAPGTCIMVEKGKEYQHRAPGHFAIRPGHAGDMKRLLETLYAEGPGCEHIVYLWGLDGIRGEMTGAALQATVETGCMGLVTLVQQLDKAQWRPALWIVTGGAHVLDDTESPALDQAPLSGLSRVLHQEHPEWHCTLLDIGSAPDAEVIAALAEEIWTGQTESEILLRGPNRYVNRIQPLSLERSIASDEVAALKDTMFRLCITTPGSLDTLQFQTAPRIQPGPGQVEIAVEAADLNFKDVMLAKGLLRSEAVEEGYVDASSLGLDCAGRIVALGEGVKDFQIGDAVLAMGRNCLSSFVTTEADFVVPKPPSLTFEAGAGLPLVFLTAYYALHDQARIRKGDRVLIHGAAGGVGLAAIQIVQQAGGEVFATVGSKKKREYLHSLGVRHVLDSRSLSFADDILHMTNGEGVDIVLNSLTGETVERSLDLLRPYGRFIEIGRRDFFQNRRLGLRPFERCLSYMVVDINRMQQDRPALIRDLLRELMPRFEQGIYRPLPYHLFEPSQISEAFHALHQSQHIGKMVVSMQSPTRIRHLPSEQQYAFRPDASYLIVGGLSGFGLATAQWMASQGARHLVLASRSGVPAEGVKEEIEVMRSSGVHVLMISMDVTKEQDIVKGLHRLDLDTAMPPLRGIVHAAMVLDDRSLLELDAASFSKVVLPKMLGAWNLHCQTRERQLDFFISYSSISALLGNTHQGNYAAGNAFLDALSSYRQRVGLPALSVAWGAIDRVGILTRQAGLGDILARKGIRAMPPERALSLLRKLLQAGRTRVVAGDVHWSKLDTVLGSTASRSKFADLIAPDQEQQARGQQDDLRSTILATPDEERQKLVQAALREILVKVLGSSILTADPNATIDLGLDSLTAMELVTLIKKTLQVDITIMQLLRVQSIASMAASLIEKLLEAEAVPEVKKEKVLV
ncbi:MAG TPA: type I polyketide synthase [Ktedonosporobacter sp.]|nr:type I polyketide synthase [Ktedonosporobacter sp.]